MKPKMINESLRVVRLYWGKSQADLANELGVSQPYLSEIERGRKEVTIDLLRRYSERLHVPMSALMLFAETMEGSPPPRKGRVFVAGKVLGFLKRLVPDDLDATAD